MVKKEVARDNNVLRRLILDRIKSIRKQKFDNKAIDDFSVTFRVFLLRYMNLNYEFTLEELIRELKKIKIPGDQEEKIVSILTLLTEAKYEGKTISNEQFKSLLDEVESVVMSLTAEPKKQEKTAEKENKKPILNFFHRFSFAKKTEAAIEEEKAKSEGKKPAGEKERQKLKEGEKKRGEKEKPAKKPKDLEPKKELEAKPKEKSPAASIRKMIGEARGMVDESRLNEAKKIYIKIMKIYLALDPAGQSEVYPDIKKLYYERKKKEEPSELNASAE